MSPDPTTRGPGFAGETIALGRTRWQDFPGSSDRGPDPGLPEFLGDLVRPYGLTLRQDAGGGQSYGEMLAGLIGDLVPPDQPADALILGFAMPDVWPERATATFLSHVCAGNPMAFAVCDQGCAAGFTALRLARDYVAGGGCAGYWWRSRSRRGWTTNRLRRPACRPGMPPSPCCATLIRVQRRGGRRGGVPLLRAVRVCPGVPAEQAWALLGRALAVLGSPGRSQSARLSSARAWRRWPVDGVPGWRSRLTLPHGQPLTGVWRELAAWAAAPGDGSLAIADYDPGLQYLCLAVFARSHD